jgi:predicted ATPase/DNA-binding XRE family transcriptional regulator
LKALRARAGLSQSMLSEQAGLSLATITALEQGRRRPHISTVAILADTLKLDAGQRAVLLQLADDDLVQSLQTAVPDRSTPSADLAKVSTPSPLIGREAEVLRLAALMEPNADSPRLVTLIGPGGVGKTRLAIAVAAQLAEAYADGVAFVDLAPLRDMRLIPATISRVLELREGRGRGALELLVDELRPRQKLLVLDNFEHVLGGATFVAELLRECPRLALLVTSRMALRLRAERRWVVEPLAIPARDAVLPADVDASPAVQLFIDRAHAVAPDFALDSLNAQAVAAICRHLDGLPLGIELAAARAGLLRPATLLQRLEHRLPMLTVGPADLPERQQTLRSALAWSHDLLPPAARLLFRRLAVFAGGWTLSAAEAICADSQLPSDEVLNGLRTLVDSSLVQRLDQSAGEPRFAMLETLREYAHEQLLMNQEVRHLRSVHAEFYSRLAEPVAAARTIAPWARTGLTEEIVQRLEPEFDNLQAALEWWHTDERPEDGLRLAVAAHALWSRLGQYAVSRRWLEAMLSLADRTAEPGALRLERGVALTEAGTLAGYQGDDQQARALHRRSVEVWRKVQHPQGLAIALANLGLAEWVAGDAEHAVVLLQEALALSKANDVPHTVAISLRNLGLIARSQGQYAQAEALFSEAAAYPLPDGWFRGYSLARSLSCLGRIAFLEHDLIRAEALFRQAFEKIRQVGVTGQALADCLDWQAALEAEKSELLKAIRLFAAADAHWRASGAQRYRPDESAYTRDLETASSAVNSEAYSVAWAQGAALGAEHAIAYALGESTGETSRKRIVNE